MDFYSVLFLILFLTTSQTASFHHHCNSDVYSSASDMADSQQLITLPYCLIDNCTIMWIDTGKQLDIIYTTESCLIVTPKDSQTPLILTKSDPELLCSASNTSDSIIIGYIMSSVIISLIILTSGYIAVVHLVFKELHNTFGKLVIIYNVAIAYRATSI